MVTHQSIPKCSIPNEITAKYKPFKNFRWIKHKNVRIKLELFFCVGECALALNGRMCILAMTMRVSVYKSYAQRTCMYVYCINRIIQIPVLVDDDDGVVQSHKDSLTLQQLFFCVFIVHISFLTVFFATQRLTSLSLNGPVYQAYIKSILATIKVFSRRFGWKERVSRSLNQTKNSLT